MSNIFNTPFEISLRIMLLLSADEKNRKSCDMIAAIDFISLYGRSFGIANENLHGDNVFSFSEFATRRSLVKNALKQLVLDGLVNVSNQSNGFQYSISSMGKSYCSNFDNDYASEYLNLVTAANEYTKSKSERDVLSLINKYSALALQRRGDNG